MGDIGCYCRVSTEDQDLDRQRDATAEYAQSTLGAELADLEFYEDKSTGTNVSRAGFQRLVADVESGDIETVVVNSISRVARSIRDLDETVDTLQQHGAALHIISESIVIDPDGEDPYQRAMLQLLGVFAELEAKMVQQRVRAGIQARMNADEEYHHGRAPLGFESEDGRLYQNEQYDDVVATLELVREENVSKRQAAHELDTSRATIDRALDRAELYGLAE